MKGEEWKAIREFEGFYEVSNRGRVRSKARIVHHRRTHFRKVRERILSEGLNAAGYPQVDLCRGGEERPRPIHSLVAEAFLGRRPQGHEVNHLDGNKANNRVENLAYVTPSENVRHAVRNGLRKSPRGEDHSQAKLSAAAVKRIRLDYQRGGVTQMEIARRYAVSDKTISAIVTRRSWKHIV